MNRECLKRNKATYRFLKKKKLADNPYFILIGPARSGKTSLLKHAEMRYILEKKITTNDIPSTTQQDFWVTQETTFIDTPGNLFSQNKKENQKERKIFNRFLAKSFSKENCHGVVIVVHADGLLNLYKNQKLQKLIARIKQSLLEIEATYKKPLPITLLINKCDLITGFKEFFYDISRDQRQQPWGISFEREQSLGSQFAKKYDALIERLKLQLFWRLQHESNPDHKSLINNFPLQMAELKKPLGVLTELWQEHLPNHALAALYFTAATQQTRDDTLEHQEKKNALIKTAKQQRFGFFIHQLFQHDFFLNGAHNHGSKPCRKIMMIAKYALLLVVLSAAVLLGTFWTMSYKTQLSELNHAEQAASVYHVLSQDNLKHSFKSQLLSLHYLKYTLNVLKTQPNMIASPLAPHKALLNIKGKTLQTYQSALIQFMLPKINHILTTLLQDKHTPPTVQYLALKTYLSLTDAKRYDPNTIKPLLQKIWRAYYPNSTNNEEIFSFFNDLFQSKPLLLAADNQLINNARKNLFALPAETLAYAILNADAPNQEELSLNLNNNNAAATVLTFADSNLHINSLYTADSYQTINQSYFKQAALISHNGNWVLGKKTSTKDIPSLVQLAQKIRTLYLADYAKAWLAFLNNIKIINFTDLSQLNNALQPLSGEQSLLAQFILLIQQNAIPDAFSKDPQLGALMRLANQPAGAPASIPAIINVISSLNKTLTVITTDANPDKKAFELATYRMRNNGAHDDIEKLLALAQVMPKPVQDWLNSIASNAWQIILFQTQAYLNNLWKRELVPQYDSQLSNRFPLDGTASNTISLESFRYFFSPNGLLDNFLENNLKPFLETSKFPWKVKMLDGDGLQISDETLKQLELIDKIQQTYFRNDDQHIFLPFTIQPTDMSSDIQSVTIKLGQQSFTFNNQKPYDNNNFIWPDNFDTNSCNITLTYKDNSTTDINCNGPWGFFKLLQNSKLQAGDKPGMYSATIQKDDESLELSIDAQWPYNPFSLELFSNFALPDTIE